MEILTVENLSFSYPGAEKKAVDGVSLGIQQGDFVVVCGRSGCGKTTLLRLMKQALAPAGEKTGAILYKGTNTDELDEPTAAAKIGYVMQNPDNQLVTDKVWHELAFGLENMGMDTQAIRRRVGEMACFFGIDHFFRDDTATLSGGQKQLLNMAAIMVMSPEILILDEPTSQLDPIAASDFIAMLQKINKELGVTVLLVEHRLEEVFPVADRVLVLEAGKKLLYNSPRAVGEQLQHTPGGQGVLLGLPSAVRLYNGLDLPGPCPLTVREGRDFLEAHFAPQPAVARAPAAKASPRPEAALDIKGVWFRYEKALPDILEGVDLRVDTGELVAVLGGNGSGKTTLLKVLSAQEKAYKGKLLIAGKKQKDYKDNQLYKGTLALLPQDPQTLFLKPTLREDYTEIGKLMEYPKDELEQRIHQVSDELGITQLLGRHPYDLSGGEQQKAALGKVLLLQPRILLLDEPTKGIDAWSKQVLGDILLKLRKDGVTILMVSHDVEFSAQNATRCAMLFDGQISSVDEPEAFFSGNQFYTTAANRIARGLFPTAITCQDVLRFCGAGREMVS